MTDYIFAMLIVVNSRCCLKCANLFEDEEEKTQEASSQLESGLHNGLNKPSNDFVLNTEPAPNAPSVAGANNPEQVTRFGSRW